jgi:hypothetical protein
MYIFKLSGKYTGFIKDANLYSVDGDYLGWVENEHVWDKNGNYRGKINNIEGHSYILKDSFLVDPSPRPPKSEVPPAEQLQPQLDIDPVNSDFNLKDGF